MRSVRVVQVVVKVRVRESIARLRPAQEGLPALKENNVGAAAEGVRNDIGQSLTGSSRRSPRPVALAGLVHGAVDEVDEVLLGDGAPSRSPRAVTDDAGIELLQYDPVSDLRLPR